MRILKRSFKKGSQGHIVVVPTDDEDLWHIYNLIQVGDCIRMSTVRKIVRENSTGLKNSEKKRLTLTLSIVAISYFSEGDSLTISIKGKNIKQNEHLQIGQYHTFMIELNQKMTIFKECWSTFEISLLKELSNEVSDSEVAAVVMEEGVAHICYIKNSMTLLKLKVEKNISKKSSGAQIHQKSLAKFFEECYRGVKSIDFNSVKAVILASPGFVAENFLKYMRDASQNQTDKQFRKNLDKFLVVKASTGYLDSLLEVLENPTVMEKLKDTKAIKEIRVLERFYTMMKTNLNKVAYGQKDVFHCSRQKAIDVLLISDKLFRTKDLEKRKVFNKLVDDVRGAGSEVYIFSSLHQSGEKLNNITGIAAILRWEMDLDDEMESREEEKDEKEELQQELNKNLLKQLDQEEGESDSGDDL